MILIMLIDSPADDWAHEFRLRAVMHTPLHRLSRSALYVALMAVIVSVFPIFYLLLLSIKPAHRRSIGT